MGESRQRKAQLGEAYGQPGTTPRYERPRVRVSAHVVKCDGTPLDLGGAETKEYRKQLNKAARKHRRALERQNRAPSQI